MIESQEIIKKKLTRMTFSSNLKTIRELRGYKPADLARLLGGSIESNKEKISKWESGLYKPRQEVLEKLAQILTVPVIAFFSENPEEHITNMEKDANNQVPLTVYKDLIEGKSEYRVVPKQILDDYDMTPKIETQNRIKIIDILQQSMDQAKSAIIDKYETIVLKQEEYAQRLRQRIEELEIQLKTKGNKN